MTAFLYLCAFTFLANYLFTVNADSVDSLEDELYDGSEKNAIFGGESILIDAAPYLAQITDQGQQICGGSILNEHWIVSAAHCFEDEGDFSVLTGSSFREKGQGHNVQEIYVHESYDNDTLDNDIALIKLEDAIKFNARQKPISISRERPKPGDEVTIVGFGRIGTYKPTSRILLLAVVPVVRKAKCNRRYKVAGSELTDNMFCAGSTEHDSCQGDSGGPAVIDDKLVGIVSFGYDCGDEFLPGIYTQISNYINWINDITGLKF